MKPGELIPVELTRQGKVLHAPLGARLHDFLFAYGVEFPCGGVGRCRGCRVRILEGALQVSPADQRKLSAAEIGEGWRLACQAHLEGPLKLDIGQPDIPILTDASVIRGARREGLGIAVDLGTTTVAAELLDLATGAVEGVSSTLNPQAAHGADVMSRVQFAIHDQRLTPLIRAHVGSIVADLAGGREIREVILVGNTVMHHLFCGLPVEPLSHAPFNAAEPAEITFNPADLNWHLNNDCSVRFLRCVGGFVGSDILAGMIATSLSRADTLCALVDLGTNGEVVAGNRGGLLCASAAAGPAFEAASIRMGMRAAAGAIHHVEADGGRFRCDVLGGGDARGICGSGLVDAIAAALDLQIVQATGRIADGNSNISLAGRVVLVQKDIRELQLAKAAIAAALRLVVSQLGAGLQDISQLYLAGAFGNYVRVASARRIGLMEIDEDRVVPAGNTALRGAKIVLLGLANPDSIECKHVPLAQDPAFQDTFVDCLAFPS